MFLLVSFYLFFCFKQKTAYEMRISDWSSDVCSSDLLLLANNVKVSDGEKASTREFQIIDSPDDALDVAHRTQQLGGTFLKHRTGWERYQRRWIMEATCNRPLCSFLLRLVWLCRSAAERLQR